MLFWNQNLGCRCTQCFQALSPRKYMYIYIYVHIHLYEHTYIHLYLFLHLCIVGVGKLQPRDQIQIVTYFWGFAEIQPCPFVYILSRSTTAELGWQKPWLTKPKFYCLTLYVKSLPTPCLNQKPWRTFFSDGKKSCHCPLKTVFTYLHYYLLCKLLADNGERF